MNMTTNWDSVLTDWDHTQYTWDSTGNGSFRNSLVQISTRVRPTIINVSNRAPKASTEYQLTPDIGIKKDISDISIDQQKVLVSTKYNLNIVISHQAATNTITWDSILTDWDHTLYAWDSLQANLSVETNLPKLSSTIKSSEPPVTAIVGRLTSKIALKQEIIRISVT